MYAGQLVGFALVITCENCADPYQPSNIWNFQANSISSRNPDFSIVSGAPLSYCEAASTTPPSPVTVLMPEKTCGTAALPYALQFDASIVNACP